MWNLHSCAHERTLNGASVIGATINDDDNSLWHTVNRMSSPLYASVTCNSNFRCAVFTYSIVAECLLSPGLQFQMKADPFKSH